MHERYNSFGLGISSIHMDETDHTKNLVIWMKLILILFCKLVEIVFEDEMFYMNGIVSWITFFLWINYDHMELNSTWRKSHIGVNNLYD
jgi:hypothetical protein